MVFRNCLFVVIIFLAGCQVPRPINVAEYVEKCPDTNSSPDPASTLFITLRLPDCRRSKVQLTNRRADRVRYASITGSVITFYNSGAWSSALEARIARRPGPPVIFIHGYNNSNDDALVRAARIAGAVHGSREVIALTWPSYGRTTGYFWDEANAEWAEGEATNAIQPIRDVQGLLLGRA